MKKSVFIGTLAAASVTAGLVAAGTLDDVKAAGELKCGVSTGVVGFAAADAEIGNLHRTRNVDGNKQFDTAFTDFFCRANFLWAR